VTDTLERFAEKDNLFTEVYELVSVVEVVIRGSSRYRIEVHKGYSNPSIPYTVNYFVRETVTLQPSYPSTEGGGQARRFERSLEDVAIWKPIDLPWVAEQSAELALNRALSFLEDAMR